MADLGTACAPVVQVSERLQCRAVQCLGLVEGLTIQPLQRWLKLSWWYRKLHHGPRTLLPSTPQLGRYTSTSWQVSTLSTTGSIDTYTACQTRDRDVLA